jgi:hypothetical protein
MKKHGGVPNGCSAHVGAPLVFCTLLLFMSCAVIGTGTIQGVLNRISGYDIKIDRMSDALSIDALFPKEAPFFIEFGADSSLTADFSAAGKTYRVEMTDFLTSKGAMGAFAFTAEAGSEPVDIGFAGRRTVSSLQFVKREYLVRVRPGDRGDMAGAQELAKLLSKRIPGAGFAPELYLPILKDHLVKGSELYFKGPKVFAQRFSPELAEALNIAGAIEGVAGRYTLEGGGEVNLVKIRFTGRTKTVEAVHTYIESREGVPMTRPGQNRDYYTVYNPDGSEAYIAEYADWLLFIPDGPRGGKTQQLFETAIRSI